MWPTPVAAGGGARPAGPLRRPPRPIGVHAGQPGGRRPARWGWAPRRRASNGPRPPPRPAPRPRGGGDSQGRRTGSAGTSSARLVDAPAARNCAAAEAAEAAGPGAAERSSEGEWGGTPRSVTGVCGATGAAAVAGAWASTVCCRTAGCGAMLARRDRRAVWARSGSTASPASSSSDSMFCCMRVASRSRANSASTSPGSAAAGSRCSMTERCRASRGALRRAMSTSGAAPAACRATSSVTRCIPAPIRAARRHWAAAARHQMTWGTQVHTSAMPMSAIQGADAAMPALRTMIAATATAGRFSNTAQCHLGAPSCALRVR